MLLREYIDNYWNILKGDFIMDKQILGSQTAKNGFANEREIADKFNN